MDTIGTKFKKVTSNMNSWNGEERRVQNVYDIGYIKKGIITMSFALLVHFVLGLGAAFWFGGVVTTKLEFLEKAVGKVEMQIISLSNDKYTISDSVKDFDRVYEKIDNNEKLIIENRSHINAIFSKRNPE